VRGAVKGKVGASFQDQGEQAVKNIADPVRAWGLRAPGLRSPAPVLPGPSSAAHNAPASNLPARPTRLIGRAAELAQAQEWLLSHRLVTITGVGGAGKTRLAIAVGEEELARRSQGVWFTDLTAVLNEGDVPGAIASALGLVLTTDDTTRQVIAYLADKSALLILDNCEHLIDACATFAAAFLAAAGRSVILATSREVLGVDGEQVMQLASLSAASSGSAASAAVQLFVERATSIAPDFHLDAGNEVAIQALCEHLDGMPLAIELAAARITVMTPAELLAGLNNRFALLTGGRRRQRQRTLEATLDWSYNLLAPELQRAFRALGVFVGGFDLEAVMAVTGLARNGALDALEALVAKSLVVRMPCDGAARFGLLETLKAYAEDRLVQADEAAGVRDRHLAHFHRLAMVHGRVFDADVCLAERLRHDRSNIVSAFDWAATNDRWVWAGELLLGTRTTFDIFGHPAEAIALFRRCEAPVEATDPELANMLRCSIATSLFQVDDWATLFELGKRLGASSDARFRTWAWIGLAYYYALSRPDRSARMRDRAFEDFARATESGLNTDMLRTSLMGLVGAARVYEGDLAAALEAFDHLPDTASQHGHVTTSQLSMHAAAAVCLLLLGEPKQALARVSRIDGFAFAGGDDQVVTAFAQLALGDIEGAKHLIRLHALEAATGRVSRQCSDSLLLLAQLAHVEGDDATAVDLLSNLGICRPAPLVRYARVLAATLGVAEQRARDEQECIAPQNAAEHGPLGLRRVMATLRAELARRGWG
jgi:predicted ATPase